MADPFGEPEPHRGWLAGQSATYAFPLPLAIAILRQQTMGVIDYATEAGVVVMALPAIVFFLVLQRFYVRGFMSGAVKG